jgi:GH15 family glucan-1,4-alpha-glucosidase
MAQVREPNTATRHGYGALLASLPPGAWHMAYTRDAAYAIAALSRMGHAREARQALDFFFGTGEVGKLAAYVGAAYGISTSRYYGDGSEDVAWDGLASPNVELDAFGELLWAARTYVDATGDSSWLTERTARDTLAYEELVRGVAAPLAANLEPSGIVKADSSVWEVHEQSKRHFAFTSLAAARGFCDLSALGARVGNTDDARRYAALAARVRAGVLSVFVDADGALVGSLEGLATNERRDASVVEAITWGVLDDPKGRVANATLDAFAALRVASGGYARNDHAASTYDTDEWVSLDLRIADALRRAGRAKEADALVRGVVQQASANAFLVPELYNADPRSGVVGAYAGAAPMAGQGAGVLALTLLDRAGRSEHDACAADAADGSR